jgi:voltage-gated potassium channel
VSASPSADLRRRLRWVFAGLIAVVGFGVGGYVVLEGWSFLDALYMTVLTLTTVGFREIRPLDTSGQVFTMILILMGVGLALVAVSLVARLVADPDAGARSRRKRMHRQIDQLHDHTIICGYRRVGRAVARELQRSGTPFLVIDPKEELRERMAEDGVLFLIDDPSSEAVLKTAGVDRARSLVCAVDSDATNVYITLIARSLRPDLTIVARASEPGSPERLERAGRTAWSRRSSRVVSTWRRWRCGPRWSTWCGRRTIRRDPRSPSRSSWWRRGRRWPGPPSDRPACRCSRWATSPPQRRRADAQL